MTRTEALLAAGRRPSPASEKNPPLRAPYTFVPVSDKIVPSPLGDALDIGRPLETAIGGTLTVRWTAETPLLVGGTDGKNDEPFRIGGTYALPGASLKGMIRSVLEIAAFGRLTFFDDYVGYTRNMNGACWRRAVPLAGQHDQVVIEGNTGQSHPQKGGWLLRRWDGGEWTYRLVKADARIVEIDRLVEKLPGNLDRNAWHNMTAHERMSMLQTAELNGMIDARCVLPSVTGRGMVVVVGQTPEVGRNCDTGKKTEAFFLAAGTHLHEIDTEIGDRFLASLQRDSNEKRKKDDYVPEALYDVLGQFGPTGFAEQKDGTSEQSAPHFEEQAADLAQYGLPVFWRKRGKKVSQSHDPGETPVLSLTALMRVPFENSLHDVAQRTQPRDENDPLDLVQCLLGWAPPDAQNKALPTRKRQERGLRSRVRFGFAEANGENWPTVKKRMIGAKPRPSFWPFYLHPKTDSTHPVDYDNPDAILSGRKRYPARHPGSGRYEQSLPTRATNETDANKQDKDLTFLEAGIAFEGEIRVRNLHPVEAGALLWAIRMGQRGQTGGPLRHMLGRAKAFGYGQVRAEIVSGSLRDEVRGDVLDEDAAMQEFEDWVEERVEAENFDMLEPVQVLRGAAHPEVGATLTEVLDFAAVDRDKDGNPIEGGERVLKAYAAIKANAEGRRAGSAPTSPDERNFIGLPPWPSPPPTK